MRDLDSLEFHPEAESIVQILCKMTQNPNPMFFRILLSYYLAKITASMRVRILTKDRGEIPVNLYAINLASSGEGKGHSTNIIEEQIINQFKAVFFDETVPLVSEANLAKLALDRAIIHNIEPELMADAVNKEYEALGALAFSFDSGTKEAVKQMRHKLLMGGIGSINFEMDEVGSNLVGNSELLNTYLELFDMGKIKQKLIKNTKDNTRNAEIDGRTPSNLMAFGTPNKLLDGGKIEAEFDVFLDTGYARRCFFGFIKDPRPCNEATPEEIYDALTDQSSNQYLMNISAEFGKLADITNYNKTLTVSREVSILIIKYKLYCEQIAFSMGAHEDIAKAEITHRYFKTLKLAGVYAFLDGNSEVTEDNYYQAICMAEESGRAFKQLLTRERNYVKLAKYIVGINREVTHVDLTEELPFYRGTLTAKNELIQLAVTWGYKNHVVIKRTITNNIEFLTGETLQKVDPENMIVAYSNDIADGYKNVQAPWADLYQLMQKPLTHWINHHSINGHRDEECMLPGFDMVVLDVDDGTLIQTAMTLLEKYKYLLYTTKRHTQSQHRFRIVMPMNYRLHLDPDDYKEFMNNVFEWLPFGVDAQTNQRARKWLSHSGQYHYNDAEEVLDARLFIPKTSLNDERQAFVATYQSMTNMERWFIVSANCSKRNNQLIKYALMLVDMGHTYDSVRESVLTLNDKLKRRIKIAEVDTTVMVTVAKRIQKRGY